VVQKLNVLQVASPFKAILDYELKHSIPPGWVNYSISRSAPNGAWQLLETGKVPLDTNFFARFNDDLHDPSRWRDFLKLPLQHGSRKATETVPPLPSVDGEQLFNEMMEYSARPDPWMVQALEKLKASGEFIIAALSNTIIFPPGHALYREPFFDDPVRKLFDVFVSSAHVRLRKPDPAIYLLALREMNFWAEAHQAGPEGEERRWKEGILAQEVLFIDDIGQNLRAAAQLGFQTMKAPLGKSHESVRRLEDVTGLSLTDGHQSLGALATSRKTKSKI
jgi:FMN phosphatase YigB (HAD superfamily)